MTVAAPPKRVVNAASLRFGHLPAKLSELIEIPDSLGILEGTAEPPNGLGAFRVMTASDGDQRITWSRKSLAEIRDAFRFFKSMVKKGFVPYRVNAKGQQSTEVMKRFDPRAEEIVFLPIGLVGAG